MFNFSSVSWGRGVGVDEVKALMGMVMTPTMEGMMLAMPFMPFISIPSS